MMLQTWRQNPGLKLWGTGSRGAAAIDFGGLVGATAVGAW